MDDTIKKILEETGCKKVKDIMYNPSKKKWIIIYQNDLYTREFDFFDDVYEFLITSENNE
jgi:hypothetical protein